MKDLQAGKQESWNINTFLISVAVSSQVSTSTLFCDIKLKIICSLFFWQHILPSPVDIKEQIHHFQEWKATSCLEPRAPENLVLPIPVRMDRKPALRLRMEIPNPLSETNVKNQKEAQPVNCNQ